MPYNFNHCCTLDIANATFNPVIYNPFLVDILANPDNLSSTHTSLPDTIGIVQFHKLVNHIIQLEGFCDVIKEINFINKMFVNEQIKKFKEKVLL